MVEVDLGKVVTDSYEDLSNKPKINGVELAGDLTAEDLGLGGQGGESGTTNYEDLSNKPKINGVELAGDLTQEDLGIECKKDFDKATGEEIHLTDSTEGKAVEFALYGKAKQKTTSGKNLIPYPYSSASATNRNGVEWVNNNDGTIFVNGTATANSFHNLTTATTPAENNWSILKKGTYVISDGVTNTTDVAVFVQLESPNGPTYTDTTFTVENDTYFKVYARVLSGKTASNATLKPMLRLASIEDDTYEPYTGGIASPNPSYPQDIEVSGESYNLLTYPYYQTTKTSNGITFTDVGDGSIVVNGTAESKTYFYCVWRTQKMIIDTEKEYILSTGDNLPEGVVVQMDAHEDSTYVTTIGVWSKQKEKKFSLASNINGFHLQIVVESGTTVNNFVVKPMIRKASVKNDRYMPYGKGSVEVKSVGKNLLPYPYYQTTREENGISITDLGDGTIKVNGTATDLVLFFIRASTSGNFGLENGKEYIFSGCPIGGSASTYKLDVQNQTTALAVDYGSGASFVYNEQNGGVIGQIRIVIYAGATLNNLVFKPMIRLATDTDDTWQPYKETISTIPTNRLAGIPVSSGGNYTDSNGQQWICDEIVKYADGSGALVQRVGKKVFKGTDEETWYLDSSISKKRFLTKVLDSRYTTDREFVLCSHGMFATSGHYEGVAFLFNNNFYLYKSDSENADDFKAWLSENNITIYYELAEPITTPLTAEQLAEISTFYPVTNISNDAECGMKVMYACSENGVMISQIIDRLNEKIKALIGDVQQQLNDKEQRLKNLESVKQTTVVYSDTEPETVPENTIVYVYETE